jgi:polyferredoxin
MKTAAEHNNMKTRQKTRETILLVSFLLFPATFYYLSPYLIIDGTVHGIVTGSFLLFVLLFLNSLILGRSFCGWVCPAGKAQDLSMKVNNRLNNRGNIIKWLIWIPWISTIVLLSIRKGGYHIIDPFYQTKYGLSIDNVYALITYLIVLALIVVPAFLFGKRSFCHSICWIAPFMILGRKVSNRFRLPSLRLRPATDKCTHCHTCTSNCPMSLPVETMLNNSNMEHTECILCGTCADGCKSGAITFEVN